MLIISREARIKVGRYAWNVYPLESFGFLLGRSSEMAVYAALPCSKTSRWDVFDDRWNGVTENLEKAIAVARAFDLEVVGFYASSQSFSREDIDAYPRTPQIAESSLKLFMHYRTLCCPAFSCSWASCSLDGRWLKYKEEFFYPRGVRKDNSINQKRILKEWSRVFGAVDYSNKQEAMRTS